MYYQWYVITLLDTFRFIMCCQQIEGNHNINLEDRGKTTPGHLNKNQKKALSISPAHYSLYSLL